MQIVDSSLILLSAIFIIKTDYIWINTAFYDVSCIFDVDRDYYGVICYEGIFISFEKGIK